MQHAVDLDRRDGGTLKRAQKHPAKRVAESHSEAALQRLGDEDCAAAVVAPARLLLERVRLLQFLPVLCVDGHVFVLPCGEASLAGTNSSNTAIFLAAAASGLGQTRRRFDGRTPLCGIGVTSRIEVIWKPTAWRARSALSRPEPGPLTSTSRVRTPWSAALRPASSAATWAAYGVDLRLPLKPIMPALDQAIALPWASVMVIMVLLKLAFTCATPEVMFLRSRRRRR